MKVQRVEWHSYQLAYEYDIPDEDIIQEFGDKETFKEQLHQMMKTLMKHRIHCGIKRS